MFNFKLELRDQHFLVVVYGVENQEDVTRITEGWMAGKNRGFTPNIRAASVNKIIVNFTIDLDAEIPAPTGYTVDKFEPYSHMDNLVAKATCLPSKPLVWTSFSSRVLINQNVIRVEKVVIMTDRESTDSMRCSEWRTEVTHDFDAGVLCV